MLRVSIYFAKTRLDPDPQYLGKRVAYRSGVMDLPTLLLEQIGSTFDKSKERILITGL